MFANMTEIKSNEREFSGQVIVWLNEFINGGNYPFNDITGETSIKAAGDTTKFPDVQVWLNRAAKLGYCGWELKTPTTRADDPELLESAAAKARAMNADHFVTWNMRDAILWRTSQALFPVSATDRVEEYPSIPGVSKPEDLWDKHIAARLKERAGDILDDLKRLYHDGTLGKFDADAEYFVGRLHKTAESLYPLLAAALLSRIQCDAVFKKALQEWGSKQGYTNYTDEEFHQLIARQVVYRLLVKILFYLALKEQWADLPPLNIAGLTGAAAAAHLKEIFAHAAGIDWHAVFEEGLPDAIGLPDKAYLEITSLLIDLNRFSFGHLPHDVVGSVFEKLIPLHERHRLGQYFTPENLVDLVLAFCVRQRDDKVLDPTCGTGTFLVRAYDQ